jgi:hypothetical protein
MRLHNTDGWEGVRAVAERIQEKYDNNDFSKEVRTVTADGVEYDIVIEEADLGVLGSSRLKLSDQQDRALAFRVDRPNGGPIAVFSTTVDRTEQFLNAELVRFV